MDLDDFFSVPYARDCSDWNLWSVQNMSREKCKQAIVADLLATIKKLGALHWTELFRFLDGPSSHELVLDALLELIAEGRVIDRSQFLSLAEGPGMLQDHMDYCGVYIFGIPGIVYPDGLIGITDQGRDAVEQIGVDGVAEMVYAEMKHPGASKLTH